MSSFTSPLKVMPTENGKFWELCEPFEYHVGSKDSEFIVIVPSGFLTDFASIPSMFWFLPKWAKYNKAPVIHDWLYKHPDAENGWHLSRQDVDFIFYEAMMVEFRNHRLGKLVAWIEWVAVRACAWLAWKQKAV